MCFDQKPLSIAFVVLKFATLRCFAWTWSTPPSALCALGPLLPLEIQTRLPCTLPPLLLGFRSFPLWICLEKIARTPPPVNRQQAGGITLAKPHLQ